MLIEETDGYTMEQRNKERVKRTHDLFIDDLQIYQESHWQLEVMNQMIVKTSMHNAARYGVKKCAEIVFRKIK